ncbi:MAG: hypothetical protein HWE39_25085 [Oceanospirillaceae bacterium]|nr:hypothetical protein [Oceanospirillaceae bacterium]
MSLDIKCNTVRALPGLTSLLILALLTAQAVAIVEQASDAGMPAADTTTVPAQASTLDVAAIRRAQLFGDASNAAVAAPVVAAARAVESPLDIRLLGVIAARRNEDSVAIVAESGRQRAYSAGETLQHHNNARLIEIAAHRILLDVAGEHQFVELEKAK